MTDEALLRLKRLAVAVFWVGVAGTVIAGVKRPHDHALNFAVIAVCLIATITYGWARNTLLMRKRGP